MANKRGYDEDDVRVRPSRSGSRRRTKERPAHTEAEPAMVVSIDRGRFTCSSAGGGRFFAVKARELGRKGIVIGDQVAVVGDISGAEGALARIVRREERQSALHRTADDSDSIEQVIVANADILAIVVALANPEPRMGLIDRCIVAAYAADMTPVIIATKSDLGDAAEIISRYQPLEVEIWATHKGDDITPLRERLQGHITVMVGHSGVGKSTLINTLLAASHRRTGEVNVVTGRGRHTSTNTEAIAFDDGWLIDTPGVRSFGLGHVHSDQILRAFPTLDEAGEQCPRGCSHDEDECALDAFVAGGGAGEHGMPLLASVRTLLRSLRAGESFD